MSRIFHRARAQLRRSLSRLLLAALFLPAVVAAQLPEPLLKPNLKLWSNGAVNVVARAPDGSIVFGGNFLAVNGTPRRHIARLKPDGTLDPDWNPGANSTVSSIVIDAGGAIFVGGLFTEIGGLSRNRIAKLAPTGSGAADPVWDPGANSFVQALALDGTGSLYAAGHFTSIAGEPRNRLAKLSTQGLGSAVVTWNPDVGGTVHTLAYESGTDMLYVGGDFTTIANTPRGYVARLSGSGMGSLDPGWNPGSNNLVYSLLLDSKGALYAGGFFSSFAGEAHARLARVSAATGVGDAAWNPDVSGGGVLSIALDDTKLYLAGAFNAVNGQARTSLARVSTVDGTLDTDFGPNINASVNHVATFGGGIVYIGSSQFTDINGNVRLGFAALDLTGVPLTPIDVFNPGTVYALTQLTDGSTLVGGTFYFADTTPRRNLLKLDSNGDLDPTWAPAADNFVFTLTPDPTGASVYITGRFLNVNGSPRLGLAKIATGGAGFLDAAWNPAPTGSQPTNNVATVAVATDGAVFAGCVFTAIAGVPRSFIAKLSGVDASLVTNWGSAASFNNRVTLIGVAPDGSVFASGSFSTIGAQTKSGFAKLDPATGEADPNWNAALPAFQFPTSLLFSSDSMYVGGRFTMLGGLPRSRLAKISIASPAVIDPEWDPVANSDVEALAFGSGDTIFVAGSFSMIDGQIRRKLAKLSRSTGALDPAWAPDVYGSFVTAMAVNASGDLLFGGSFDLVGSQARQALTAVPQTVPLPIRIFENGFE